MEYILPKNYKSVNELDFSSAIPVLQNNYGRPPPTIIRGQLGYKVPQWRKPKAGNTNNAKWRRNLGINHQERNLRKHGW